MEPGVADHIWSLRESLAKGYFGIPSDEMLFVGAEEVQLELE